MRETLESKVTTYVTIFGEDVSAEGSRNLSQPARIITAKVNLMAWIRVYCN